MKSAGEGSSGKGVTEKTEGRRPEVPGDARGPLGRNSGRRGRARRGCPAAPRFELQARASRPGDVQFRLAQSSFPAVDVNICRITFLSENRSQCSVVLPVNKRLLYNSTKTAQP